MSFFCCIFAAEIVQDERSGLEFPGFPATILVP